MRLPTFSELDVRRDDVLSALTPGQPFSAETLVAAACDVMENRIAERIEEAIKEIAETHELIYGPYGADAGPEWHQALSAELRKLSPDIEPDMLEQAFGDGRGWNAIERGETAATMANGLMALYSPALGEYTAFLARCGINPQDYTPVPAVAAAPRPAAPPAPAVAPKEEPPTVWPLVKAALDLDKKAFAKQLDISPATLNNWLSGRTAPALSAEQARALRADLEMRRQRLDDALSRLDVGV